MKTKFSFIGILTICLIGLSAVFVACDKDENTITIYKGQVVHAGTSTPFADLEVKLTDGQNINASTRTDASGYFFVQAALSSINDSYYFLIGDASCEQKQVKLFGWGQSEVNLGIIEVQGPTIPVVELDTVLAVATTSATFKGHVISDGRHAVTERGFCYAKTDYPTIDNNHKVSGKGIGEFMASVSDLDINSTYYVCAYATNEMGTAYSRTIKFTTTNGLPAVTTVSVTDVTAKSAICNADVTSDGGFGITACGVCWSATSATPTIADKHTSEVVRSGAFAANVTNLSASTTYCIRAYATNENGTSYGETKTFTTTQGLPTVTTTDPGENITSTSIATGGNVTDDGGFTVTARGVVYSTLPYPTLENASKVKSGSGTGYFSANITNISPMNNTYYIRAYATNVNGTSYGEQITITPERSEYLSLPIVEYGGYRYHVYKDMGSMNWQSAVKLCDDLTFAGYDDWFLPDQYELRAIGEANIRGWVLGNYYGYYWSASTYSSSSAYYCEIEGSQSGTNCTGYWNRTTYNNKSASNRVRPVRKDKIQ